MIHALELKLPCILNIRIQYRIVADTIKIADFFSDRCIFEFTSIVALTRMNISKDINNDARCISLVSFDSKIPKGVIPFIIIAFSILIVCTNLILMYSLYKTDEYKTITNKFVFSMCVSDFLTGMLVLPLLLFNVLAHPKDHHCILIQAVQYSGYTFLYFSVFMLLSIAGDRYLHVTKLNLYNRSMSHFKMKVIIVVSILLSNTLALFTLIFASFYYHLIQNTFNVTVILSTYYFYYILL